MTVTVRPMEARDVPACVDLINHTIRLGGSTAYEEEYDHQGFHDHYLIEPPVSNVALAGDRLVGFQAVFEVDPGIYSIGSFADQRDPVRGVGRALFDATLADCRKLRGSAIIAKITSDNSAGLAFYSRMGFEDFTVIPNDHTRKDGTAVDRIIKRFALD